MGWRRRTASGELEPYRPAAGTRAATAIEILARGAVSAYALAPRMNCETTGVHSHLRVALRHGLIARCTVDGASGYRLASLPPDLVADLEPDDFPATHVVDEASVKPTTEALRWANPFGLTPSTCVGGA